MTRWVAGLAVLAALATPVRAQTAPVLSDTVLADRRLTADSSTFTLHLRKAGVYRALVEPNVGQIDLASVAVRGPSTLVSRADSAPPGTWELYVTADGDFSIRLRGIPAGDTVRFRLIGDRQAAYLLADHANHSLSLGIGAAIGMHGTYEVTTAPVIPGATGGSDHEAYLVLDSGHRISGAFGFSRQSVRSQDRMIEYFFVEPRVRVITLPSPTGRLDAGAAVRYARGNTEGFDATDPGLLAPAVFLTEHFGRNSGNRGWSAVLSLYYAWLRNTRQTPQPRSAGASFGIVWLP